MADITKINTFIQSSPHPAWLATAQGQCVYANPALERLTGFNSDQIKQADWRSFLLEQDRAVASASWQRSLATGTPYRVQVRMRTSDGAPKCVELIAFGHKTGAGPELWLFTGFEVNGVTAQKRPELEAQLQATLNVIPADAWYALPSGALTFVNERHADYLGLPKDHPLRFGVDVGAEWDSHLPLLHPDDHAEMRRAWSHTLRTGSGGEVSFRARNAEGGYRWFLSRVEPLRASDGTLLYWIGVTLDIDDAKRAEDALRKSEKELRDAIDTIPALVWSALPDGSNASVNKRFVEYTGSSAEQVTGSGWEALVHPDDLERHAAKWREALATGKPHENEVRSRRSDGQYRWHLDRGLPLRDEDGNIVKWYGVTTDIEDRKRAEEALGVLSRDLQESKAKLEEAQRITHVGYWEWDLATDCLIWSDETYRIFGLRPQERPMNVDGLRERIHPEDRDRVFREKEQMITSDVWYDVEHRIVRPSGEVRVLNSTCAVKKDEWGQPTRFYGTVQDITERKRAEEALRRSEAYLAEAQRLSHTGSWAWNPASGNTYYSEECYRVLGFAPGDGTPPPLEAIIHRIHPDDQAQCRERVEKAIRDKVDFELDYRIVHPDRRVRDIHCVCHTVLDRYGDIVELVGTVIDITERKSAEQQREKLRQLEADLAHTNRVSTLGEMAASLAHEIKQPIAAAITSANTCIEWLAHEPPNLERARAAAARIDKYGNRAAEIIDRIRSLYKKSPPQRELVDVNGIVDEMLALLKGEATRSSIAMRTDLSAELPKIMVDRVQLQQVFMNLMLNAIEAMQDSGGELMVKSQLQDGQLQFSVSDTGMGLPMEKMDQIFSAFFTTKTQGSGMGLAISRSIVESHGGRLWATANDGRGATFHFILPTHMTESALVV
jgi:PAS domain S-box-containing protein